MTETSSIKQGRIRQFTRGRRDHLSTRPIDSREPTFEDPKEAEEWRLRRDIAAAKNAPFNHEILTREEEVQLANCYRAGVTRAGQIALRGDRNLTTEDKEILTAAMDSRERLLRQNLKLIQFVLSEFGRNSEDLFQEGFMGLMKAVENYDPDTGNRFSTYATKWIRQAVGRKINEQREGMRLPIRVHRTRNDINKTADKLRTTFKREPTIEEIAKDLQISPRKVRLVLSATRVVKSLDEPFGEDGDFDLHEALPGSIDIETDTINAALAETITELLEQLATIDPRLKDIISMRYGLNNQKKRTLADIGAELGVTKEWVRQLEIKALQELQKIAKERSLKDFL